MERALRAIIINIKLCIIMEFLSENLVLLWCNVRMVLGTLQDSVLSVLEMGELRTLCTLSSHKLGRAQRTITG